MRPTSATVTAAALAATALATLADPALAHTGGVPMAGLTAGFLHPFGGLDHILAMVAVGALAALVGGRALWAVPLAFIAAMTAGALAGGAGIPLPGVETGIALSVVALGLAAAAGRSVSAPAAVLFAGVFAVFHGHAHGAEMPAAASGLLYGAGFVAATLLLHVAGLAATRLAERAFATAGSLGVRVAGAITASLGLALAGGVL